MNEKSTAPLLSKAQLAERLGVSPKTVQRIWESGRIEAVRVGTCVRFTEQGIQDFLKANLQKVQKNKS